MRIQTALLVIVLLVLAGCSSSPSSSAVAQLAPNRALLFLDFIGGMIAPGATDNSATGTSSLVSQSRMIPAMNADKVAPSLSPALVQAVLVDRVRSQFRGLNIDIVDQKPDTGLYTRVYVGGSADLLGEPPGVAGIAPLDCNDTNGASVAFAFADEHLPVRGGIVQLATTISHEAAHTWGLVHVDNPGDVLFSVDPSKGSRTLSQLFAAEFTTQANFSAYSANSEPSQERCGHVDPINNRQLLIDRFGAADALPTTQPTFAWSTPAIEQVRVPLQFRVTIDPTAGVNFRRLELYQNFALIEGVTAGSLDRVLKVADGQVVYVVAEMVDISYLRTRQIRRFEADAALPLACDSANLCPSGQSCALGLCATTPASGCAWSGSNQPNFIAYFIIGVILILRGVLSRTRKRARQVMLSR